jgi:hypothetical protein
MSMNWYWIVVALTVPAALAVLVALLYSVKGDPTIGAILGSGVVFASCVGLIGREYAELARLSERCLAAGIGCRVYPEPHMRFGIYACIALVQVFGLFLLGQWIEERNRRRTFAPEWR